jgi:AraC-like DNA-binding protein
MEELDEQLAKHLSPDQLSNVSRIRACVRRLVSLGKKFTGKDISEELNLSEYNINKILIKSTGETLKILISKCRMEHYENQMNAPQRKGSLGTCLSCRKRGFDLARLSIKSLSLR